MGEAQWNVLFPQTCSHTKIPEVLDRVRTPQKEYQSNTFRLMILIIFMIQSQVLHKNGLFAYMKWRGQKMHPHFWVKLEVKLFPISKIWDSQHIFSMSVRWEALRGSKAVLPLFCYYAFSGTVVHQMILDQNFWNTVYIWECFFGFLFHPTSISTFIRSYLLGLLYYIVRNGVIIPFTTVFSRPTV